MRAMWSGAVSFGLVSVPVKVYSATTNHDIRFHQVHASDGGRIKYKRTCSLDGAEVEYADIVKGYETEEGELITLTEEDLDSLPVRDKAIVLQTMLWPDEVREPDFEILDAEVDLRPQEQKMAASLVESLGADFDPDQFHDEYREAVAALIERKKTTGDARPAPVAPAPTDEAGDSMTHLLTALQRSVEAAKAGRGGSA